MNRGSASSLLLLLLAAPARAETSAERKAAAESLFESGVRLLDQGKISEACRKFEASQELDAGLGTLLYLGDCYEREGRTASAWAMFREARSQAAASGQTDRRRVASEREKALEQRLSSISFEVPDVPGLKLELDGHVVPRASFGVPLPVDPGLRRIEAQAPGRHGYSIEVVIAAKPGSTRVSIPVLAPKSEPGSTQRLGGYVTLGAGVGGLLGATVLGILARDRNDESLAECDADDSNACSQQGVELRDEARGLATASTVGFAAGGALAVTGLVLVLSAPDPKSQREVVLGPTVRSGKAGLELRGRF